MKCIFGLLAAGLVCLAPFESSAADGVHLFILSGQSNMDGLDPDVSFTPAVQKAFGAEHTVVVKDAYGGQPIRRWYKKWQVTSGKDSHPNGDLYDRLMAKVKPAIEGKKVATVTFVWMQGESDAHPNIAEVYAASLRGLRQQLAEDLKRDDLNFVIGRISDCCPSPSWTMIREAEVKVAETEPRSAWVDTDDLNGPQNDLHYTAEGYAKLGTRFAEKAIQLIQQKQR